MPSCLDLALFENWFSGSTLAVTLSLMALSFSTSFLLLVAL